MTAKTNEYLQAGIIVVILVVLIFIFNLPKNIFYNLTIVALIFIIFNELFPPNRKKYGRKREYITPILFYLVFAAVIFICDLPKKLYLFIGILAISSIVLSELFNLIKEKEE